MLDFYCGKVPLVPWIALFSANRWRLDILTFPMKGFGHLHKSGSQGRRNHPDLVDRLTLFQPGGRLCPPHTTCPPPPLGFFDLPTALQVESCQKFWTFTQCYNKVVKRDLSISREDGRVCFLSSYQDLKSCI